MGEMTRLAAWSEQITKELAAAGFAVSDYQGFPLVKRPAAFQDGVRVLEFRTSMPCDRTIYAEGMLFSPAGAKREAQRLSEQKGDSNDGQNPTVAT